MVIGRSILRRLNIFFVGLTLDLCWPIETEWTVLSNEGCVDLYSLYMGGTISNTVTDGTLALFFFSD